MTKQHRLFFLIRIVCDFSTKALSRCCGCWIYTLYCTNQCVSFFSTHCVCSLCFGCCHWIILQRVPVSGSNKVHAGVEYQMRTVVAGQWMVHLTCTELEAGMVFFFPTKLSSWIYRTANFGVLANLYFWCQTCQYCAASLTCLTSLTHLFRFFNYYYFYVICRCFAEYAASLTGLSLWPLAARAPLCVSERERPGVQGTLQDGEGVPPGQTRHRRARGPQVSHHKQTIYCPTRISHWRVA